MTRFTYASEPLWRVWDFCVSLSDLSELRVLDQLWIFQVRRATYKYQTGRKIWNPTTQSTMQACSFFSNPFSEFCFLTPTFFSTILLHKFVQVLDTLKIPVCCFGTRDTLKKVISLILSYTLFLLNIQNSWPHWSSTYLSQFSTGNHFHVKWSTNPRVTSILPTANISLFALPGRFQLRYYCSKFPPRFSVC